MKKFIILVIALITCLPTATGAPLGNIDPQSWTFQDRDIDEVISTLIEMRRENDRKNELMLPLPYPKYQNLINFANKFNTSQLKSSSNFLKNLGQDVSGTLLFTLLLIDVTRYREIVLATIYIYSMHRYPNEEQRLKVYHRITVEEGFKQSNEFDEDFASKMLQNESEFLQILYEAITP